MRSVAASFGVLLALVGCASPLRRFPLAEPMWIDRDDMRPLARPPEEYDSVDIWDFVDQSLFRPLTRVLAVETRREAVDVNSMDEVPDSSWFTNRLGRHALSPEQVSQGACEGDPPDPSVGPWLVTGGKPNGVNPGFMVRTPDGRRFLLKPDGETQPELASAADAIGSRIYWAAGFETACVRVVYIDRAVLRIAPGARYRDAGGQRRPLTWAQVEPALRQATRSSDGRYRLAASQYIPGAPLGPFRFQGIREDDPNDVVPHEDRRELRASRLLAAWINHYDAREQNTFTSWIDLGAGRGYVRHWMLDFGDAFGNLWPFDEASRRSGHSYPVDWQYIAEDFVSLGLIRRPWDDARIDPEAWVFAYFRADDFVPEDWRGISPNPAFVRMTERDAAWMARIVARFDTELLRAAIAAGRFTRPEWSRYLERTLIERRRRILVRYLTRLSPLADVAIEGERVCATDLATMTRLRPVPRYSAVRYWGARFERRERLAPELVAPSRVCVSLGAHIAPAGGLPDTDPLRYLIVDLVGAAQGRAPLRVHLYDLGPRRGWRLVGLERPETDEAPRG